MTCVGTWVPAGPSRNAALWPLTWSFREGNWERTHAVSKVGVARTFKPGVVITRFSVESRIAMTRGLVSHTGAGSCTANLAISVNLASGCGEPDCRSQTFQQANVNCIQVRFNYIEWSNLGLI